MSTNYINKITDTAGTTHDIAEGVDTRLFRATCSTTASTAAKVATLEDSTGFSLATGVRVMVTFTYGNSAGTPTLRVDGSSTGTAKTIATPTAAGTLTVGNGTTYNTWGPYESVIFTYNGTYWVKGGTGYATYKAYANSGTDTKLQVAEVTSGTTYYPIVGTGTTAATRQYDTTGMQYIGTTGTASAAGTADLYLGNSTATGTAGNKTGKVVLYGSGAYAAIIDPGSQTAQHTLTLPNKTGTIALTSDLSYYVSRTETENIGGFKVFINDIKLCGAGSDQAVIYFGGGIDNYEYPYGALAEIGNSKNYPDYISTLYFKEHSRNTSDDKWSEYGEIYSLPGPANDMTADVNYDILTTKSKVTIAQGGTGSNTALTAFNALGAKHVFLNQTVSSSSSVTLTLDSAYSGYHAGIVVGIVQGVGGVCLAFASGTSTTAVTVRNVVGNTSWSNNTLKFALSNNKLTLTSTNSSPSVVSVYAT